jgi:hypothetical protein
MGTDKLLTPAPLAEMMTMAEKGKAGRRSKSPASQKIFY